MTLPASGAISLYDVNIEMGVSGTATRTMNDSTTRTLFGVASGTISMSNGYGKANNFTLTATISASQGTYNVRNAAVAAGWDGVKPLVCNITVNSGVALTGTGTGTSAGFVVSNLPTPTTVNLYNYGYIRGYGGAGGTGWSGTRQAGTTAGVGGSNPGPNYYSGGPYSYTNGSVGGPAIYIDSNISFTITNYGTINGGGGGAGGQGANNQAGGNGGNGGVAIQKSSTNTITLSNQNGTFGGGGGGGAGWGNRYNASTIGGGIGQNAYTASAQSGTSLGANGVAGAVVTSSATKLITGIGSYSL